MAEIEESARLYEEHGALVMTAVVINGVAEGRPSRTQVTFVLTRKHLVSVRYADPVPFRTFALKASGSRKLQRQATGSWSRSWRASSSGLLTFWNHRCRPERGLHRLFIEDGRPASPSGWRTSSRR